METEIFGMLTEIQAALQYNNVMTAVLTVAVVLLSIYIYLFNTVSADASAGGPLGRV